MEDFKNAEYWTDLCGSRAAYKLGIKPGDISSAEVFDEWFFAYYPYLVDGSLFDFNDLRNKKILEIGLGYGSIGRKVSRLTENYVGVDISDGPVSFLNSTLNMETGRALQASVLDLPFKDDEFDFVISIGCLHHTGNSELAFKECFRVLRPGGKMICMVYNAYSYKRWIASPIITLIKLTRETFGKQTMALSRGVLFDRNIDGKAPPHTEFLSKRQIKKFLPLANSIEFQIRNIDNLQDLLPVQFQKLSRDRLRLWMLQKNFGKRFGLDLYMVITR